MRNLLDPLYQELPWARSVFAWVLLATIVLILSTIPAYFFLYPLCRTIRSKLTDLGNWLAQEWRTRREENKRTRDEALGLYSNDHLLVHLITTGRAAWARTLAEATEAAKRVRSAVETAGKSSDQLADVLPALNERLQSLGTVLPNELPQLGDFKTLRADVFKLRVARTQFLGASSLVAALVFVNTGMLSQILGGLISQSIALFGVPLYYPFATLITLAESGLGFAHGVFSDSDGDSTPHISLGAIAVTIFAIGIALVEGFFYSRIHQNRSDTVTLPFLNYTIPQTDIYFLWGFLLVMALFTLGLITYRARVRMLKETSASCLRKELARLQVELQSWSGAVKASVDLAEKAKRHSQSQGEESHGSSGALAIQSLIDEISKIEAPPWCQNIGVQLGRAEIGDLLVRATAWLFLAILSTGFFLVCCVFALARIVPAFPLPGAILTSAGLALLIIASGLLTASNETIFADKYHTKVLAPQWSRTIGVGLIIAFEAAFVKIMLFNATLKPLQVLVLLNMIIPLGLFAAAYQLLPLLGLASVNLRFFFNAMFCGLLLLLRAATRTVETLAVVFENIFQTLASPWTLLFGRSVASQASSVVDAEASHSS